MKKKKGKLMYIMQWVFGLLMFGMLLYFIVGELFLPGENELNTGECRVFDAQWMRELPDGSRVLVEVPGVCEAGWREPVSIETTLPENLEDKTWLCLHSSRQDVEIYIDNVLRQQYTTEQTRLFGKNSASAYIFLELKREDAGKTIRIITVSDSGYNGRIDTIYMGERMGIWTHLLQIHGVELVFAFFVGILGIIIILFGLVLHHFYNKIIRLEYLGWGVFLAAVCLIMASRLRQFLFPNISVASGMAFFSVMLMPLPFLLYFNSIQKHRYQKYYILAGAIVVVNLTVCTLLQLLNVSDFSENSVYTMVVICLSILLIWITMCVDIYQKYIKNYILSALGFLGASLAGILEMAFAYQQKYTLNGMILCTGLLFFQILAVLETGQWVFRMEREKQQAVFANEFKGKFLVNMSREMQDVIDKLIRMNEQILRENHETEVGQYAAHIQSAGKTLTGLITDMMDFSSMDAGNLELVANEYSLGSFIEESIHVLREKTEEKHLEIRINVDENLPSVLKGDEVRNRKILMSLFSNSVKYTQKGSITFSVQGIWTEQEDFILSMSVADTGIGIEKERVADIFDVVPEEWQENNETGIKGTGLGLHMIKQLIDQMQGTIQVWSVQGEGSLFTVEIPQEVVCKDSLKTLQSISENRRQQKKPETHICQSEEKKPETHICQSEEKQPTSLIHRETGMAYCGEDAQMYQEVLETYYEQGQKYYDEIPKLLEKKDWKNYGIMAHAIKSTSMTIGATALSELAKRQEFAAKEGREEELLQEQETFFRMYQQALQEVKMLVYTGDALDMPKAAVSEEDMQKGEVLAESLELEREDTQPESFSAEFLEGCHTLLEHVKGYEMNEALDQIEKLSALQHAEILEKVRKAVDDFQYDAAETYLQEWFEEQEKKI